MKEESEDGVLLESGLSSTSGAVSCWLMPRYYLTLLHLVYSVSITSALLLLLSTRITANNLQSSLTPERSASSPFRDVPYRDVLWSPDVTFVDDDLFRAQLNGSLKNVGWDSLRLRNGYWLELEKGAGGPDSDHSGLPARFFNSTSSTTAAFVPSFHHQLHCLMQLKINVIGLQTEIGTRDHLNHCIELIRHAIVCAADTTLESPAAVHQDYWDGPDGWGRKHTCRDWSVLNGVIEEYGIPQAALLANAKWLSTG